MQRQNKNARVCKVRNHGLTIVQYPAAAKQDQKQNTKYVKFSILGTGSDKDNSLKSSIFRCECSTLPPGYARTHLGGFYHS